LDGNRLGHTESGLLISNRKKSRLTKGVKEPDGVDVRPGRIPPRTGAMVMLYPSIFKDGWTLDFTVLIADGQNYRGFSPRCF